MSIKQNLIDITSTLPPHVTLVAVSKTKSIPEIMEAYNAGHRVFGENKIQEMVAKHDELPEDIQWHMIGHVQRNKVKYMAGFVSLVHGVDSFKLLKEINRQAEINGRIIDCLFQIKIASEDSKFGMSPEAAIQILQSPEFHELEHIKIKGVMGMASFTDNQSKIKQEFALLQHTFDTLNGLTGIKDQLEEISMGMSADYRMAIDCGSTMVRVGSIIFGERNY